MLPDVSQEVVCDRATVDELLQREKNGRPLMYRLFEIYLEETPRLLEALERAVANGNEEDIYDVVHQMKGSAAALGARKLFRTTEAALTICRRGDILKVENLVERVEAESDAYINEVTQLLGGE